MLHAEIGTLVRVDSGCRVSNINVLNQGCRVSTVTSFTRHLLLSFFLCTMLSVTIRYSSYHHLLSVGRRRAPRGVGMAQRAHITHTTATQPLPPLGAGELPDVSVWRSILIANEWCEMQTSRHTVCVCVCVCFDLAAHGDLFCCSTFTPWSSSSSSLTGAVSYQRLPSVINPHAMQDLPFTLMVLLFFLKGINLINWATAQPNESDLGEVSAHRFLLVASTLPPPAASTELHTRLLLATLSSKQVG